MGQVPSKESGPRVFEPKEKFDVGQNLENALEKNSNTDYLRQQVTDKYIEQLVSERLRQLEFETYSRAKYAESHVPELDESRIGENDSPHLQERLKQLDDEFQKRPKIGQLNSKEESVRKTLTDCLLKNSEKPLHCQEEFENFRELVNGTANRLNL